MLRWYITSLSLIALASSGTHSAAADLPPVYKAAPAAEPIEYGNLYFGVDFNSHHSLAGYVGVLWAPTGMNQSGLRLSAFGLGGKYQYNSEPDVIKAKFVSADAMIGYGFVGDIGTFTIQVGANFQDHRLSPDDPSNLVQGEKVGFKVQGDFWMNPTPQTMLSGLASYSTAFDSYYTLGRAGIAIGGYDSLYIGPEVSFLGNLHTDIQRAGAHLSGIKIGSAALSISGGWMHEKDEGDGWYGTAILDIPF